MTDPERRPNTGPCTICQADAPRYGTGWPPGGASPLCPQCQDNLAARRAARKADK